MLTTMLITSLALILDWLLGEPRRYHPLVGFGKLVRMIEGWIYRPSHMAGILAVTLALAPVVVMSIYISSQHHYIGVIFSTMALYFAIGHKSLHDHAKPIITALNQGDEAAARSFVARIVSRDPATLKIIPSACESILENGNDGVFGALFWFFCAGAPGAIFYRLANTLDAMWGYRNSRYAKFGWAAARLDDGLNWVPARLTACTYALLGNTRQAIFSWRKQAPLWDSPNAGPVMAAGAGALQIQIGGPAQYHGEWHTRPVLGIGTEPTPGDIDCSLRLVRRGVLLWLTLLYIVAVLHA